MNSKEILLVEDNENDAELTISALSEYILLNTIEHAKDGPEALEYMFGTGKYKGKEVRNPKVVLLDLKLPKLNGLEVLKKLKADKRTKNVPVVMLTSSSEEPDIEEAYSLGANSYIVKPVEFDKFAESIKKLGYYWMIINKPSHKL